MTEKINAPEDIKIGNSVGFPQFCENDPDLWFLQIEAIFDIAHVHDDETKFKYLVANLESSLFRYVEDIMRKPPAEKRYRAMKERIIFSFTEPEKTARIVRDKLNDANNISLYICHGHLRYGEKNVYCRVGCQWQNLWSQNWHSDEEEEYVTYHKARKLAPHPSIS